MKILKFIGLSTLAFTACWGPASVVHSGLFSIAVDIEARIITTVSGHFSLRGIRRSVRQILLKEGLS